jgi:hypothetical protein
VAGLWRVKGAGFKGGPWGRKRRISASLY